MSLYRPRAFLELTLPEAGSSVERNQQKDSELVFTFNVRIRNFHLTKNDFNLADELDVVCDYKEVGLDPRALRNAIGTLYVGEDPTGKDEWNPSTDNIRFVGIMSNVSRRGSEEDGVLLEMKFLDYTTLFIESKHYDPNKVPLYSQTLKEAWATICDATGFLGDDGEFFSTVKNIRNRIKFEPAELESSKLGDAVLQRFQSLGKIQLQHPDMDSWALWRQCMDMMGLISFIELDQCIVTTATDYYTIDKHPTFVWGHNIETIVEERNSNFVGKSVVVISYDPLTNTSLEAVYPPRGDSRAKRKRIAAKAVGGKHKKAPPDYTQGPAAGKGEDRLRFDYPSVTSQDRLNEIAKRIWLEISRQELGGSLTTREMRVSLTSSDSNQAQGGVATGELSDLLDLRAGDSIVVTFDDEDKNILNLLGSESEQINYLLDRGYSMQSIAYLIKNLKDMFAWVPEFLVKRVEIEMNSDESEGEFKVSIHYINMINIEGSSDSRVK